MSELFYEVFRQLRPIYAYYLDSKPETFNCVTDEPDELYLDTCHIMPNKKPLYFGSVKIRKNYVAFHVMPVYVFPALLESISPELKRRMQGKSCFNFKKSDPELFAELAVLVKSGFVAYQQAGYIK